MLYTMDAYWLENIMYTPVGYFDEITLKYIIINTVMMDRNAVHNGWLVALKYHVYACGIF